MQHDNDNAPPPGRALPLALRLARAGRRADLERLIEYGQVAAVPSWLSAESNLPEAGAAVQADRIKEVRPSPDELVRLVVQDAISARGDATGPITSAELDAPMKARIRFDARGIISEWRGGDNRWHPAAELFRQPKGRRRKSEQERQDDNARHLSVRGSGSFPEPFQRSAVPSEGEDFRRLRAAHWVRAMGVANDVDRRGIGAGKGFEDAWRNAGLYPACRIPRYMTVIAKGAEFLAYRMHSNTRAKRGGVEGGHDLAERQIVETIDAPRTDAALGKHAGILDMSIAGLTAKEVGIKLGFSGKLAERRGVTAQDDALAALKKLAA